MFICVFLNFQPKMIASLLLALQTIAKNWSQDIVVTALLATILQLMDIHVQVESAHFYL